MQAAQPAFCAAPNSTAAPTGWKSQLGEAELTVQCVFANRCVAAAASAAAAARTPTCSLPPFPHEFNVLRLLPLP